MIDSEIIKVTAVWYYRIDYFDPAPKTEQLMLSASMMRKYISWTETTYRQDDGDALTALDATSDVALSDRRS